MPYIKEADRVAINQSLLNIRTVGDLNYFITIRMLREWSKSPSYTMIHVLHVELVQSPKDCPLLNELRTKLADRFTVADIYSAARLAFNEFYRRIGVKYEKSKIEENGDLLEYQAALDAIGKPADNPVIPNA